MDLDGVSLHGACRRSDALAMLGRYEVARRLDSGELRAPWRGVLVDGKRTLDPFTRGAAALLVAGPDAALCGTTVAILHGCTSPPDADVHLLLPYEHAFRPRRGMTVHRGAFFAGDVCEVDGLRRLALDRCLADLLCTLRDRDALAVVDEALRLAGDGHDELRRAVRGRLLARRDPRGTRRGAALLDLADRGAESPPESWLRLLLVDKGFPLPEVNHWVRDVDDVALFRVDLAYPRLRIAVEYDGYVAHAGREGPDAIREAELRRRGWIVVRADRRVFADPAEFERALRAAFTTRGYVF